MLGKRWGLDQWWICFTKETREFLRKKMGFGANGGFDFTKELKEMLRKKMGFGANGGFALQRIRENS